MEDVRQLVQEEGREARNLVAFHVAVDTPTRVSRKPPRAAPPPRRAPPRAARLRSASAGRDKRSELRARYWALLFGDLQRAVGEIYNTVEAHENLNECQEVILVLENYTRDFKALGEWFRLKWEYDNTPPPQRPQSLAWEIRKTDFVRPESRRTHSVKSSPSVSGKNSPCLSGHNTPSGKNSPNLTGKASPCSGKISPRVSTCHSSSSPKANIEFFTNKIVASKITNIPEPKSTKEPTRLSDIKEKDFKESDENNVNISEGLDSVIDLNSPENSIVERNRQEIVKSVVAVEIGKAEELPIESPKQEVVTKSPRHKANCDVNNRSSKVELSAQAVSTISQLDAMENELLVKQLTAAKAKNENFLNEEKQIANINNQENLDSKISQIEDKDSLSTESPTKSEENFADISNESSPKSSMDKSVNTSQNLIEKSDSIDEVADLDDEKISNDISNLTSMSITKQVSDKTTSEKQVIQSNVISENTEFITIDVTNAAEENDDATCETINVTLENNNVKENPDEKDNQNLDNHTMLEEQNENQVDKNVYENGIITDSGLDGCKEQLNDKEMKINHNICDNYDVKIFNEIENVAKEPKETKKFLSETKEDMKKDFDFKKNETKLAIDIKTSVKPAYSQAAAKPKPTNAIKTDVKTPTRTALVRSSTVVEMRPNTTSKTLRPFQKRNQANKCSYPFNLTTSRTSLFDTSASNNVNRLQPKRPVNRNYGMASGDAKSVSNKVDLKKRPPRPTDLKISGKGEKKEKIKPPLEKIKDYDEYSSCDTIVTQIDMSRIESNESLKTLVPEDTQMNDVANSVEVLNMDNSKNDNEGWLTVKSKRLSRESKKNSKSHWANRFHQPSATTSLPTLNMLESPKEETNVIIESPKLSKTNRAKSEQPEKVIKPEQVEKVVTVIPVSKDEVKPKDPSMIRQKSDVTGLRTKSSKNKTLTKKAEKVKDTSNDDEQSELTKNRLHSSLESLTTGLERSQESTEEPFDFDKWKAEFMSTFKYLDDDDHISNHNEILKAADPSEMSEIAEMTSQIEENEKKIGWALDIQSEVDQRKLCEEEDSLNRQIMELQQVSDIDLDTETDDTETDAEIPCEDTVNTPPASENLGSLAASLEDQYETALAGMTWAERVDTLVVLEALVARDPGRAQQLHAKLSQGIKRRGSLQDALRRLQAKQARAEKQRIEYQTERAKKIHQLLARVEEVKVAKNQLIEEKRLRMERRLQKAAENRDQYLKDIVKKAHDEDEKLREIAFIKQLQAQNRRHDFLAQCRHHTTRLRQMRRDRLSKLEEKAAREAAVGARRQALEEARRRRVESMMQRRRLRDERVQGMRELRRQERGDAAREKAEGVKSRLSALAAAAEQEVDALRSRIRDKQDASQQRLELHLQAVREKATGPRQPTTSESHEQPNNEAEEAERLEQERREREKQKNIKKKARKLRQKLLVTGNENPVYDDHSSSYEPFGVPFANKMYKVIQQISNIVMPLCAEPPEAKQNTNGIDLDEKPKKHKNKKSKAVNGDVEDLLHDEKKKSKKNKEKNGVENNNNTEMEIAEERVESKKKKKKNKDGDIDKNGKDKPKLSKASSVCSSLSDTSRSSKKCDARVYSSFDNMLLERQLNELYRMMEKFDKLYPDRQNIPEKVTIQKMQGLKVIGHMLALASEREELASQFTTKSLCTAVALVSRAAAACNALGAFLLSTNATVHIATLLHATLEKDLHSDPKEMELARHLSDCLSVALDSVLCSSRVHDDQPRLEEDIELLGTLRNRAHMIISYLCLSGCIARAEYAGEARESVQTLLTVCADLCHPCDADVGSERTSAKQSLRCALGAGLCGSRAEFCALFAGGAELGHCGSFVRAARTAHLLRALAEMDHLIVQEAFGEGGWPLEFRAAVARLLSQHAPNDKEAPRTPPFRKGLGSMRLDQSLSETMVLDLIVLVGFVIVNNPQLQETICDGWSVIKMLCTLPANWLVSPSHSHALLPTLVALAERPATAAAIAAEFSVEMLKEYMESPEAQKVKLVQVIKQGRNKKNGGKNKNSDKQ